MKLFAYIRDVIGLGKLPDLANYEIKQRPRNKPEVTESRTTTTRVVDGKAMRDAVEPDGTIVTTIGKTKPKTTAEVEVDAFDEALLDFVVGVKWRKDRERAAVMKWHWIQGHSARQIEVDHTDKQTSELQRGYSERTAAEFIKAFFDADDERESKGRPRLRAGRYTPGDIKNVIEW